MKFTINVRVTRAKRCRDGFYLICNGSRIRFSTRRAALEAVDGLIMLQTFQVVTVREYAERNRKKIKAQMPKENHDH
jgi:hypothetical protein